MKFLSHKTLNSVLPALLFLFGAGMIPVSAHAGAIIVDYTTLADTGAAGVPAVVLGGTTVTGSANVTVGSVVGNRGLGISGGTFPPTSDFSLDLGEAMSIDYGQLVTNVTLDVVDIDPAGNVTYHFEAFDGAISLGTFNVPEHVAILESKDLTALAGGIAFSKITLFSSVSAPAGLQIQRTTYDVSVPEPASLLLLGLGLAGIGFAGRRPR